MSKIEKYQEQRQITNNIISNIRYAQGLKNDGTKDSNNDKYSVEFYDHQIWDSDIPVYFHASYGYYGSSSGYSACSPELQPYLIKALDHYKTDIISYIMEAAKHDEHIALLDCKTEAEQILAEISKVMINKTE